jgi:hypothetical protein
MAKLMTIKLNLLRLNGEKKKKKNIEKERQRESLHRIYGIIEKKIKNKKEKKRKEKEKEK